MNVNDLKKEIILINNVLIDYEGILSILKSDIVWDKSINSRRTASFGVPYNYSNINYNKNDIPLFFKELVKIVNDISGFTPNNCLVNFYYDNNSKMGYHSDQIDILYKNTGVVIFSLGSTRVLRFKNKIDKNLIYDIPLLNNSYFYMSQKIQKEWLHSILADSSNILNERFSITFRKII
jgi:alkylated DNA repair dioxygenase AlkB